MVKLWSRRDEARLDASLTLEQKVWRIWSYCRENQRSLDSHLHIQMIREVVDAAVGTMQQRIDGLIAEAEAAAATERAAEKKLRAAMKTISQLTADSLHMGNDVY